MSTVKANNLQLGQSGTATQNFTLTAASADGTAKLARGNVGATTQDVITVASDGKVDFPAGMAAFLGTNRSLTANGYQKLPGGLTVQWGLASYQGVTGATGQVFSFNVPFPNACLAILASDAGGGCHSTGTTPVSATQFRCWGKDANGTYLDTAMQWAAIGY